MEGRETRMKIDGDRDIRRWENAPWTRTNRQDGHQLGEGALRQAQASGPRTAKCSPTTRQVYAGENQQGQKDEKLEIGSVLGRVD